MTTPSFDPHGLYPNLLENLRHLFFVYNLTHKRVEVVNAAYETLLRRPRAHVHDDLPHLLDLLHPDDRAYAARCWRLWGQGRLLEELELRLLHPDGTEQYLCIDPYRHVDL